MQTQLSFSQWKALQFPGAPDACWPWRYSFRPDRSEINVLF